MVRVGVLTVLLSLGLPSGVSAGSAGPIFLGDPQAVAEVQVAMQKFTAVSAWKARMSLGGATQTLEHAGPDRFHLSVPGDQAYDMYVIGHDAWMRTRAGCQRLPAPVPFANPGEMMASRPDMKITVTKGAPEPVEGIPAQTYTLSVDAQGMLIQEKLFVTIGTGLPRRFEVRGGQGTVDQGTTVIDYFDYGVPIAINNPPC